MILTSNQVFLQLHPLCETFAELLSLFRVENQTRKGEYGHDKPARLWEPSQFVDPSQDGGHGYHAQLVE